MAPPADPLVRSWHRACAALGIAADDTVRERLVAAYAEPHRRYHDVRHLRDGIAVLEPALHLAEHAGEVELALWFHDAVYDVQRRDNEAASAQWAAHALRAAGAAHEVVQRVHALVMATRHDAPPPSPDAALLVDVDLAILGAPADRYDEYERDVRAEHGHVGDADFARGRCRVVRTFAERPSIYATAHFRARLDDAARANLRRAIARWCDTAS